MSDLRLHDHEALARAHLDSALTRGHVEKAQHGDFRAQGVICLPVIHLHVLEKFWFGRTRLGGFRKTGAVRCRFWLESVEDLKASLESRGQQLLVRYGSWAQRHVDVVIVVP
eukprot:Skav236804  [mRNA]  locus=scaffold1361:738106:738583:- [translate_table: standard]